MKKDKIVVFDLETTGCNPQEDKIIEIGAVLIENDKVIDEWNQLINPGISIPQRIEELTSINDDMLQGKPYIEDVLGQFIEFCADSDIIMGHNIMFDYSFIKANANNLGYEFDKKAIDTLRLATLFLKDAESRKLGALCDYFNIDLTNAHRATHDAKATYNVYENIKSLYYIGNEKYFEPQTISWIPPSKKMITDKQKDYLRGLTNKHKITLEKPLDEFTSREASKCIDEILRKIRKE